MVLRMQIMLRKSCHGTLGYAEEWQINKFKYYGDLHIYISKNLFYK